MASFAVREYLPASLTNIRRKESSEFQDSAVTLLSCRSHWREPKPAPEADAAVARMDLALETGDLAESRASRPASLSLLTESHRA